jgi:integrase
VLYVSEECKSGRSDPVPLTESARSVLSEQPRRIRSAYVFHGADGNHYDTDKERNRISTATRKAMARAGIHDASFHTLRHTAASWMVQAGRPLAEIQRFLRHRSIVTTMRYAHLAPEHLRDTASALDAAIGMDTPVDTSAAVG